MTERWTRRDWFALGAVLVTAGVLIFTQFLTKPAIWSDEALNVQIAKNLAQFGHVAIQLAPGVFSSHLYYYTSSTGWVLLASVALAFKLFGVSFVVARAVMALYALGFLSLVFAIVRRTWGWKMALASGVLLTTFAPFLGNGKSVLGEVPGLFWLAVGLWIWTALSGKGDRRTLVLRSLGAGFACGLFFATKPAFLLLGAPPLGLVFLIEVFERRLHLREFFVFWIAVLIAVLPTLWFGAIHPITLENLRATAVYYSNNYNSPCVSCDIANNLHAFVSQTTFFHLEALLVVLLGALWLTRKNSFRDWRVRWCVLFGVFVLAYFIKSPGTNRYLLPLQLIALALFPIALDVVVRRIRPSWSKLVVPLCVVLSVLQVIQYVKFSDVVANDAPVQINSYIQNTLSKQPGAVGVISAPVPAAMIPSDKLVQFIHNNAYTRTDGTNVLTLPPSEWPDTIIYAIDKRNATDIDPYRATLDRDYTHAATFGSWIVLEKRR